VVSVECPGLVPAGSASPPLGKDEHDISAKRAIELVPTLTPDAEPVAPKILAHGWGRLNGWSHSKNWPMFQRSSVQIAGFLKGGRIRFR
jgi:hypothetical protein